MNNTKEDAVSPVIGVMLMLAVTIIIAACVSAFAGGASTQFEETPQTSLLVYCDGSGDAFSIIFEHHSGASIQSEKLKIITWIKAEDNTMIKHEQSGISPPVRLLSHPQYEFRMSMMHRKVYCQSWSSGGRPYGNRGGLSQVRETKQQLQNFWVFPKRIWMNS
ncbi:type IV pilin N-terminal domain-containing protein [Methanogenium cariaci]|uniref:type IV pilin N-terminal domain-containing protein n=1 Tax=Methanogenium cariaci TaxID=2197 RepID=UPI00078479D8|nr:type IV pilin N-terminal domain-containing protein [Methanogenium cariaci]